MCREEKETGMNTLNFVFAFITVFGIILIFYFVTFKIHLVSLENYVSNGVEMAESYVLTSNYQTTDKSIDRYHIVIPPDTSNGYTTENERLQIEELASVYLERIKKTFALDENNNPTATDAKVLWIENAAPLLVTDLTIYDIVYEDESTYRNHTKDNVSHYIRYDIEIEDNKYKSYTKTILDIEEAEYNGKPLEGALITSTVSFGIGMKRNVIGEDMPLLWTLEKTIYMDIVNAHTDSRTE